MRRPVPSRSMATLAGAPAMSAQEQKEYLEKKTALIKRYARAQFLAEYLKQSIDAIEANGTADWAAIPGVVTFLTEGKETVDPSSPDQTKRIELCFERLQTALSGKTTQTCLDALPLLLLSNASFDDSQGIRTEISRRLFLLGIEEQQQHMKGDDAMGPLVGLDERGLVLYFDSRQGARQLLTMLNTLDIHIDLVEGDAPSVGGYESAIHQLVISHGSINQFLAVLQFLPTNIDAVVNDLYKAVNKERNEASQIALLSREQYLLQSAAMLPQIDDRKDIPVYVPENGLARMPHPTKPNVDVLAINVAAQVPVTQTRPHIIILFDDSGSMVGEPLEAANAAVKKLLRTLRDDVLVSLQPFNQKTVFCRQPVQDIRESFRGLDAPGSTPLIQTLMSSAVFMRSSGDNPLLSQEEMDRTAVLLLTDGQENVTSSAAIASMQTSLLKGVPLSRPRFKDAITVERDGLTDENFTSYGTPMMPCRQLPAVLPVGIGSSVDRGFLESLAEELNCPAIFVETGENCNADLDNAFNILTQMRSRVGHAYVGVIHPDGTCLEAKKVDSLFDQHQKCIYMEVPADARVSVRVMALGKTMQFDVPAPGAYLDGIHREQAMKMYFVSTYIAIKKAFDLELSLIYSPHQFSRVLPALDRRPYTSVRGSAQCVSPAAAAEGEAADIDTDSIKQEDAARKSKGELKEKVLNQLYALKDQIAAVNMSQSNVHSRVSTLIQAIKSAGLSLNYVNASLHGEHEFMVQHTQMRSLGIPVKGSVGLVKLVNSDSFETLCARIVDLENAINLSGILADLAANPEWRNSNREDAFQNTIFMLLLRRWKDEMSSPEDKQIIEQVIVQALKLGNIELTKTDSVGNTALHNAAWWGVTRVMDEMLVYAENSGQLAALGACRNRNSVGATVGETILDNIFMSSMLTNQDKKKFAAMLLEDSMPNDEAQSFTQLRNVTHHEFDMYRLKSTIEQMDDYNARSNSALEQYGTLLHNLLFQTQNPVVSLQRQQELKGLIVHLLDKHGDKIKMTTQNLSGQTTLHTALWYGHFDVAWQIIQYADRQGCLAQLLTLRNIRNETPLMNLGSQHVFMKVTTENGVLYAKILNAVQPHLTVLQIAELSKMLKISQASLQGYSVFWHLDKWPVSEYHRLNEDLSAYLAKNQSSDYYSLMFQLHKKLRGLKPDGVNNLLEWVNQNQATFKSSGGLPALFSSSVEETAFKSASRMLQTIKDSVKSALEPAADVAAAQEKVDASQELMDALQAWLVAKPASGAAVVP